MAFCVNFFPLDTFCAVVTSWAANLGPGDPTCTFSGDGNSSQWLAFAVVIASRQRFYQQDSTIKLQNTCAKLPKKMYHQRWRYWAKAANHPTIKTNDWKTNLLMFRAPLNEALPIFFPTNLGRPSVSTWWERPNWTVRYRLGDIRCSFETWHRDDTYKKKQWNKWFIIQSGRSKAVVSLKKHITNYLARQIVWNCVAQVTWFPTCECFVEQPHCYQAEVTGAIRALFVGLCYGGHPMSKTGHVFW
jgi:hypothetical protein